MKQDIDINKLMKGIMREKYYYIPVEALEKIKEILDKKLLKHEIKSYGWCYHKHKGMYYIGLTQYFKVNSYLPLAC